MSDSAILWAVAHKSPLSMGFSRQEYWSGLPCPLPGDLPNPGIEPSSHTSPTLADGFLTSSITWEVHAGHYPQVNYVSEVEIVNIAFITLYIPSSNTHTLMSIHTPYILIQLHGCYGKIFFPKKCLPQLDKIKFAVFSETFLLLRR